MGILKELRKRFRRKLSMKDNKLFWKVFFHKEEFRRRLNDYVRLIEFHLQIVKEIEKEIVKEQVKKNPDWLKIRMLFEKRNFLMHKIEGIQVQIGYLGQEFEEIETERKREKSF